jgi:hypothetical protein
LISIIYLFILFFEVSMFLAASKKTSCVDLLLDTSLSFEARSLYILIDSLAGDMEDRYAPSLTVLAATTDWPRSQVRRVLAELSERQLVQELNGHEERYAVRIHLAHHDRRPVALPPVSYPNSTERAPAHSSHNVLSQEEISALLSGFC